MQLDGSADFYFLLFGVVMRFLSGSDKGTAGVHQILCDNTAFLSRVITGDVNWIYCYDPETKQQPPNGNAQTLTETEKGDTGEEQSQEHTHHCLWHQGNC
jgi:hypothetical protein